MGKRKLTAEHRELLRKNRIEANKKFLTCEYCQQPVSALNIKRHSKACLDNPNHENSSYILICFKYHKRKCVVCSERRCVEVHHLDGNRTNNSPINLIPLCANHHRYWHSKYKVLIEQKVLDYVAKFNRELTLANDS